MSSAELLRDQIDELTKSGLIQSILESVSSCKRIIWQTEILENYTTQPLKIEYLDVITKSVLYNLIKSTDDIVVNANIQIDNAAIACDEYVTALLENILHNAWKHNLGNDKLIWITLKEEDSGYQFIVSDNGPGITEDLRNNGICVQGRSSGIGLYICHVLIEKYQGWMHITDRIEGHPEKGTQVSVWFPKYNQSIMHDSNQP